MPDDARERRTTGKDDDTADRLTADKERDELAAAVEALLSDRPGREAVAATVERFSWPAHAELLSEIYQSILKTRSP